jgi:hypothetical protein
MRWAAWTSKVISRPFSKVACPSVLLRVEDVLTNSHIDLCTQALARMRRAMVLMLTNTLCRPLPHNVSVVNQWLLILRIPMSMHMVVLDDPCISVPTPT